MNNTVWIACYIDRSKIATVDHDLKLHGFKDVVACIPTVRLLKKTFKGENVYEDVPLLFNYGFFNIPYISACNPDFLIELRQKIGCLYGFIRDAASILHSKPHLRPDNETGPLYIPQASIVKEEEIAQLLKTSEHLSVFSEEAVDKLAVGNFLILRGYPYDNMPAEIVKIDKQNKTVKVKLLLETMMHEVQVNFDNVFYTVYSDFDEESNWREKSLDEMAEGTNKTIDKLYASINYGD